MQYHVYEQATGMGLLTEQFDDLVSAMTRVIALAEMNATGLKVTTDLRRRRPLVLSDPHDPTRYAVWIQEVRGAGAV